MKARNTFLIHSMIKMSLYCIDKAKSTARTKHNKVLSWLSSLICAIRSVIENEQQSSLIVFQSQFGFEDEKKTVIRRKQEEKKATAGPQMRLLSETVWAVGHLDEWEHKWRGASGWLTQAHHSVILYPPSGKNKMKLWCFREFICFCWIFFFPEREQTCLCLKTFLDIMLYVIYGAKRRQRIGKCFTFSSQCRFL